MAHPWLTTVCAIVLAVCQAGAQTARHTVDFESREGSRESFLLRPSPPAWALGGASESVLSPFDPPALSSTWPAAAPPVEYASLGYLGGSGLDGINGIG